MNYININKFIPMHDRVLVKIDDPDEVSPGGIILLKENREMHTLGVVVKVGIGRPHTEQAAAYSGKLTYLPTGEYMPVNVKIGDTVLIGAHAGAGEEMKDGDDTYRLVYETAIQAVLES